MDLFDKLDKTEIKTTDRFPEADMEFCRQAEKEYHDAYNVYSELSYLIEEINDSIQCLSEKTYIQKIDDCKDKVYGCNKKFIRNICGYFKQKYSVSIDEPDWKIIKEDKWGYKTKKDKEEAVTLQYILDSVYEQMSGMSFEEKAFHELKEDARESMTTHQGKSKYCVRGKKLVVDEFYWSHKDYVWGRYTASIDKKHRSFFKALTHFEYKRYEISNKYDFLCDYKIDEETGVYDRHYISSSVIEAIKLYKNGKVEIDFKNNRTAMSFINTYFPGVPQQTAA